MKRQRYKQRLFEPKGPSKHTVLPGKELLCGIIFLWQSVLKKDPLSSLSSAVRSIGIAVLCLRSPSISRAIRISREGQVVKTQHFKNQSLKQERSYARVREQGLIIKGEPRSY